MFPIAGIAQQPAKGASVIVVRQAFVDCPDRVIQLSNSQVDAGEAIRRFYPSAKLDGMGGFDTEDGGSYLYDRIATDMF